MRKQDKGKKSAGQKRKMKEGSKNRTKDRGGRNRHINHSPNPK
jgi:hypothetical protein